MEGENIIVVFQFCIQILFSYKYEILRLYNLPFSVIVNMVFLQNTLLRELLLLQGVNTDRK